MPEYTTRLSSWRKFRSCSGLEANMGSTGGFVELKTTHFVTWEIKPREVNSPRSSVWVVKPHRWRSVWHDLGAPLHKTRRNKSMGVTPCDISRRLSSASLMTMITRTRNGYRLTQTNLSRFCLEVFLDNWHKYVSHSQRSNVRARKDFGSDQLCAFAFNVFHDYVLHCHPGRRFR
jgi:hypothetical protein